MGYPAGTEQRIRSGNGKCAGCLQVVYRRRRNPDQPLVCFDEAGRQLPKETRVPIPMAKGLVQASDVEPVIGALLTIGSVVWSVADKRGR